MEAESLIVSKGSFTFYGLCGSPVASDGQGELASFFPLDFLSQVR